MHEQNGIFLDRMAGEDISPFERTSGGNRWLSALRDALRPAGEHRSAALLSGREEVFPTSVTLLSRRKGKVCCFLNPTGKRRQRETTSRGVNGARLVRTHAGPGRHRWRLVGCGDVRMHGIEPAATPGRPSSYSRCLSSLRNKRWGCRSKSRTIGKRSVYAFV